MQQPQRTRTPSRALIAIGAALVLSACGGGGADSKSTGADAPVMNEDETLTFALASDDATLPPETGSQSASPAYHLAPTLLDEPSDIDAIDNTASALARPHVQEISSSLLGVQTRGLTVDSLAQGRVHALSIQSSGEGAAAPSAATAAVTTFTPAQIRAAYSLPTLPSASLIATAAQAAQQGAGQTIYIIDAMNDPNAAAELAAFDTKFGLPTCTSKAIGASTSLPLAAASVADACTLSIVYSTSPGTMTASAPAYDASWATEIALDVQWAHATAPRARIVLIEAADASINSLLAAVKLANAMGPGVVSMSFGGSEGSWTASVDSAFAAANMTYLGATGDAGSGVSWPAVSPNVLAVGGTSLVYSGVGTRSEKAWSSTGGGISAYTAVPVYQSNQVPGVGTLTHRAVADVSFNADPYTGQFVAVIPSGSAVATWLSAGGTSLSTPQWAGLAAVANAIRAQAGRSALGAPHSALYTQIAQLPGSYAAAFKDVQTGADGSCHTCAATVGYDVPTGLGSPNATALLATLSGAATTSVAAPAAPSSKPPVVVAPSITGAAGKLLTGNIAVSSSSGGALSVTIAGAPAGASFSVVGQNVVFTWAKPVTGQYALTITATDALGLSTRVTMGITVNSK